MCPFGSPFDHSQDAYFIWANWRCGQYYLDLATPYPMNGVPDIITSMVVALATAVSRPEATRLNILQVSLAY